MPLPATVAAQTAGDTSASGGNALVEVVVTARRRSENLQDVPITVTAVTAEAIRRTTLPTLLI